MKIFCLPAFVLLVNIAIGQDLKTIEQHLVKQFQRIEYWDTCMKNGVKVDLTDDSILAVNRLFRSSLLNYTRKYPATITARLDYLSNAGVDIATSEDGMLRIYSWDTETGGTAHIYEAVYQYKAGNKIYSKIINSPLEADNGDIGHWYSDIWQLRVNDKNYYITVTQARYGSLQLAQGIKIFTIENGILNSKVHLIKTSTGIKNELWYEYTPGTVEGAKEYTNADSDIRFDKQTKTISIPVVLDNGTVTDKRILYRFTGKYFEKISS